MPAKPNPRPSLDQLRARIDENNQSMDDVIARLRAMREQLADHRIAQERAGWSARHQHRRPRQLLAGRTVLTPVVDLEAWRTARSQS